MLFICSVFYSFCGLSFLTTEAEKTNSECAVRTMIMYPVEKSHQTLANMHLRLRQTTTMILMILTRVELQAIVCFVKRLVYH